MDTFALIVSIVLVCILAGFVSWEVYYLVKEIIKHKKARLEDTENLDED